MSAKNYFQDIHSVIASHLEEATTEIKVAMAWFTDTDLMALLGKKASQGLAVEVIVAENEQNAQAPYADMIAQGVILSVYPASGYSGMHNKFCVIDQKAVLAGSYNWTFNARKKNKENLIVQESAQVAQEYLEEFERFKADVVDAGNYGKPPQSEPSKKEPNKLQDMRTEQPEPSKTIPVISRFEAEWNVYLNSEVRNYDKEELRQMGFDKSRETHGNPTVLPHVFDTIYQQLLSDTEVDTETKEKLRHQLDQRSNLYLDRLEEDYQSAVYLAEKESEADEKAIKGEVISTETETERLASEKEWLERQQLPDKEKERERTKEHTEELLRELTSPPISRRIYIVGGLLFFLSFYLFLFYSSVMYTIVYGKEDAVMEAQVNGTVPSVDIFNPNALAMAWDKGIAVLLFISLFTVLPFVFGFLFHRIQSKRAQRWAYLVVALVLDVLLAYLIAKNVYVLDYEVGRETEAWNTLMAFELTRFWLVMILGFVPYVGWGALLDMVWGQLEASGRANDHFRKETLREQLREKIDRIDLDMAELKERISKLEQQALAERGKKRQLEKDLHYIAPALEKKKLNLKQQLSAEKQTLVNQKEKIIAYLDKDRIPVSYNALKDRLNTLLSGWDAWLYEEFSAKKSHALTEQARGQVNQWLNQKKEELHA